MPSPKSLSHLDAEAKLSHRKQAHRNRANAFAEYEALVKTHAAISQQVLRTKADSSSDASSRGPGLAQKRGDQHQVDQNRHDVGENGSNPFQNVPNTASHGSQRVNEVVEDDDEDYDPFRDTAAAPSQSGRGRHAAMPFSSNQPHTAYVAGHHGFAVAPSHQPALLPHPPLPGAAVHAQQQQQQQYGWNGSAVPRLGVSAGGPSFYSQSTSGMAPSGTGGGYDQAPAQFLGARQAEPHHASNGTFGAGVTHQSSASSSTAGPASAAAAAASAATNVIGGDVTDNGSNNDAAGTDPMAAYWTQRKIGEGAYGEVFEAQHRPSGQKVALKIIKVYNSMQHGDGVSMGVSLDLIREIKFLTSLAAHPQHFVRLLDVFFGRIGDVVLVFEYMDADLYGMMSSPGLKLTGPHRSCLMRQLLQALATLHAAGIMHRDCKASNLLINSRGQVKLADFGLATNYSQRERFGCNVVTLWYRGPELLLGDESYGPAVDVWAAGCIFHEIHTMGRSLFRGRDERSQLDAICLIMGTPTADEWPEAAELPEWDSLILRSGAAGPGLGGTPSIHPRRFRDVLSPLYQPAALDLLERLLALNPARRISAEDALKHPYFEQEKPCDPSQLPKFEPIHDFEARRRRHRNVAQAQAAGGGGGGPAATAANPSPVQPPPGPKLAIDGDASRFRRSSLEAGLDILADPLLGSNKRPCKRTSS